MVDLIKLNMQLGLKMIKMFITKKVKIVCVVDSFLSHQNETICHLMHPHIVSYFTKVIPKNKNYIVF
jgi:hypothetical protein